MSKNNLIHIYIITTIIVAAVSYFMVDRISLRAAQLANNTMDADYTSRSIIYAVGITMAYSALYWLFVRDLGTSLSEGEES